MKGRCLRICGNMGNQCLIDNKEQIDRISDMVINKVCSVQGIIETAREEVQCGEVAYLLDAASENTINCLTGSDMCRA